MEKFTRVLVSNRALPSTEIGSWTTRLNRFLGANPDFFHMVLSPHFSNRHTYCKKRRFLTWRRPLRQIQLRYWVARDYIIRLKTISRASTKLRVLVMDDPHLLEAIGDIKDKLNCEVELIYSFHGFELSLPQRVLAKTDKIVFLTKKAAEISKRKYSEFPEQSIVGNAVASDQFYALDNNLFELNRIAHGYTLNDTILIWMSNDRPRKGFYIFEAIIKELLEDDEGLKVILIGTDQSISDSRVRTVGRLPNAELPKLLQLGDCYMFTTMYQEGFGLSMIEAYKCGNAVIASDLGGISEVLNELPNAHLISNPEDIEEWVSCYKKLAKQGFRESRLSETFLSDVWTYEQWEAKFINALA